MFLRRSHADSPREQTTTSLNAVNCKEGLISCIRPGCVKNSRSGTGWPWLGKVIPSHGYISPKCDNSSLLCWRLRKVSSAFSSTAVPLSENYNRNTHTWLWPNRHVSVLVAWQQRVLLMQALTEGEGSKSKGLGWPQWHWPVALKSLRP